MRGVDDIFRGLGKGLELSLMVLGTEGGRKDQGLNLLHCRSS